MALTKDELVARRSHIGGSDVPAILGLDPYRTITDVYMSKLGLVEEEPQPNLAAEIGDRLEPVLVAWARDRIDPEQDLTLNERFWHENGIFAAQVDGWMPSLGEPIESKTSGLVNGMWRNDEWGDDGTDEVPHRVLAQVNFQLLASGAERGHVAAFLGAGVGPRFYEIHRHPDLIQEIHDRCEHFWNEHVLKEAPPDEPASLATLEHRVREPSKLVSIDESLGEWYAGLKEQAGLIEATKKEAKRQILEALGDAEIGATPWGEFHYKANKNGVRRLVWKELK